MRRKGSIMRRRVEARSLVAESTSEVLHALTSDTNRCAAVFEEVTTSGSDASFQIVEEFILSDPGFYDDPTLVEKAGRRKSLTDFGRKVEENAGYKLYSRVFKAQELLQKW